MVTEIFLTLGFDREVSESTDMSNSHTSLKDELRSIGFTTAVPFADDGDTLARERLEENLEFIYERGGRLFIPNGNTGEYYSLTDEERCAVTSVTCETLPDDATVVSGAGGSTKEVQKLLDAYEDIGVDAAMIMNPSHTYIHEQGLLDYYEKIIESTDLSIVVYKRGEEITPSILDTLSRQESVVGVKYAVNDISSFGRAVDEVEGDLVWMNGLAERFAPAFAVEGAEGHTTGIGNFAPEPCLELQAALDNGEYDRAERIAERFRHFEELRQETGEENNLRTANNVPAIKYGLELIEQHGGPVREPLVSLSEHDRRRAEEYYDELRTVVEASSP